MAFFTLSVGALATVVTAVGAGLGILGAVNYLEGSSDNNAAAKNQGIKQFMAGGGIILIAQTVIPSLTTLF